MAHPLTDKLARTMHEADGSPATMANGQAAADAYRGWAESALDALVTLCDRDGHNLLGIELDAVGKGYGGRASRSTPAEGLEAAVARAATA